MNDHECKEVFDALIKLLQAQDLGWVESQVREEIRLGKTIARERKAFEDVSFNPDESFHPNIFKAGDRKQLGAGPSTTFPDTVEYSAEERLQLLINAIEHAVVNTAEMEESFTSYFETEFPHFENIQFYSEDGTVQPRIINRQSARSRTEKAKKLRQLLEELRKEI
jgi:hypothetical protein